MRAPRQALHSIRALPFRRSPAQRAVVGRAYAHLLSPGQIGTLSLRNRITFPAMGVGFADEDGSCGDRLVGFMESLAKGGAALVTLGVVGVGWPLSANQRGQVALSDDKYVPGLRRLADAVHAHGAKLSVQLNFAGLLGVEDVLAGNPAWTPSVPPRLSGNLIDAFLDEELADAPLSRLQDMSYRVASAADIQYVVSLFAAAAVRAKAAGADAIEIQACHGHFISSFLSPFMNQRTDEYGGPVENRARVLVEVIRAMRDCVGKDFPLWCKIDSQEYGIPEGISLRDAQKTAILAQQAGASAIAVSSYQDKTVGVLASASHTPDMPGRMLANAAAIKSVVDIPVLAAGRIEPEVGDREIALGHCDFVAMGRKLLADPDLPRKLRDKKAAEIRPCIYCYTCISENYQWRSTKCAVNPEMGFEQERAVVPGPASKRVAVIGGGPAGMEAARRLALKGHDVTLFEQSDRLGGTLPFAALAYEPNQRLLRWLIREVERSTVKVRLRTRARAEALKESNIDEIVVATGAMRPSYPIAGGDQPFVFSGDDMRQLIAGIDLEKLKDKTSWFTRLLLSLGHISGLSKRPQFLRKASEYWLPLGRNIVVIGNELVALELAEFLAHRRRKVTVVDDVTKFGKGLPIVRRWRVLDTLDKLDVTLLPGAREIVIGDHEVSYRNPHDQIRSVAADHVIIAKGARGDLTLADQLRNAGLVVHSIGDCNGVGYIAGALEDAAMIARAI